MNTLWANHIQLIFAIKSGFIVAIAWFFKHQGFDTVSITLFILAYIIGGYFKAREGIEEFIHEKRMSVEILMILAAIGAAIIGYWMEGAILIFIFALSGALETYTMNKSEQEISKLMDLQPEEATLVTEHGEKDIPISELQVGDIVLVKAGERIPADGEVATGSTSIDESAITGEAIPVQKDLSDKVFSGTVNLSSTITFMVTQKSEETLFQKIIDMVQSAKEEKSPSQQWIERFEGPYVKTVLIVVLLMMILPHFIVDWSFEESFYRAMVLLVVASPCALVASVMPATLSAISNGARHGILFKGGVHLEQLGNVKAIGFDKTGTITNGTPVVTDVIVNEHLNLPEFFATVAAIEEQSSHPLAKAITTYCKAHSEVACTTVEKVDTVSGWGLDAIIAHERWKVGKKDYFPKELVNSFYSVRANEFTGAGKTTVYVGNDQSIHAIFALQDTIRDVAPPAIDRLKQLGIHTYMITGDNESTAKSIAEKTKLDGFIANCLPDEKVIEVKRLREEYGNVAMVGDGINDAPALATANVGIAMGAGTDAAIETADVVLIKNNLEKIPQAIYLSKKMNRIIKQNIALSISVIILLIVGNFMQQVTLPLGVIGHEGSTILVILNGLRLLRQ